MADVDSEIRAERRDRAVLQGAVSATGVRLLTAATSFVALGIAARSMRPDEFGLVAVLSSILLVVTMFDLGLSGALGLAVAKSHGEDDRHGIRDHTDSALIALTGVGALIAVAGAVSALTMPWSDWIGATVDSSTVISSLIITFVISGLTLPASVGFATLTGIQRFTAAQMSVALGSILAVVTTAIAALFEPSPEVFVVTILGSPLVPSLGYTLWTRRWILRGLGPTRVDGKQVRDMLRMSGWFALFSLANTVTVGTGTMVVGSVTGLAAAGIFSVVVRLFSPVITVVSASGALLQPSMREALARGDVAWVRSRYLRGLIAVAASSAALCLVLVGLGRWLCKIWVGSALVPPLDLLVWTAAFMVTISIARQASGLIMAVGRIRILAGLAVGTAVLSLGSSVLLAREFGIIGPMIGAVAACLFVYVPGVVVLVRGTLQSLVPVPDGGCASGH